MAKTDKKVALAAVAKAKALVVDERAAAEKAFVAFLAPIARGVNARLEKADKGARQAEDHRVAAAILLAEAKAKCEGGPVTFKKWAEANVKQSFQTVRKLAVAGATEDPAATIAEVRTKNKDANKKLRAQAVSRDTTSVTPGAPRKQAKALAKALISMSPRHAEMAVLDAAQAIGLSVVAPFGLEGLLKVFKGLKPSEQMDFLNRAADLVGVVIGNDLSNTPRKEVA